MSRGTLGFKIEIGPHPASQINAYADAVGGHTSVVINDPYEALIRMDAGERVIYRKTSWGQDKTDDHAHENYDARSFVRVLHAEAPTGTYLYLGNEPGRGNLPRLRDWTLECQAECKALGRKYVIFNFETGVPEPADWLILAPCLVKAKEDEALLGAHWYATPDAMSGYNFPWHIGRTWRDTLNMTRPEIVITELGILLAHDKPLDGYKSIPDYSLERHLRDLRAIAAWCSTHGIAACIFILGGFDRWFKFNMLGDEGLRNGLAQINRDQPYRGLTTPAPVPPVVPAVPKPENAGASIRARLVPKTGFTSVNVRVAPNVTAPLVIEWSRGLELLWYPATERSGTGYQWVWVEAVLAGQAGGWMARVQSTWAAQFESISTPPAPDVAVVAETPFYSQYGAGAVNFTNDCGPASGRMIIGWNFDDHGLPDLPAIRVDDVSKNAGKTYSGFTSIPQLMTVLGMYGVDCYYTDQLSLAVIEAEIRAGFPSIALINYRHILKRLDQGFTGGHFVVPVGYNRSSIFIHDPGFYAPYQMRGRFFEVPRAEFQRAISDTASAGNKPNQGILLRHN